MEKLRSGTVAHVLPVCVTILHKENKSPQSSSTTLEKYIISSVFGIRYNTYQLAYAHHTENRAGRTLQRTL